MTSLLAVSRYDLYALHLLVTQNMPAFDVVSGGTPTKLASLLEELGSPEPLLQKEAENPIVVLDLMTDSAGKSAMQHQRELKVSKLLLSTFLFVLLVLTHFVFVTLSRRSGAYWRGPTAALHSTQSRNRSLTTYCKI